ncbi:MAG: hypothetical protein COB85_02670 [Bacteroidetes bacterium]|nr:MAG: hypothetical protein COB85_02670 [Bacteroidota bacterium]
MLRLIILFVFLSCSVGNTLVAQDFENYTPLKCSGAIPEHITRLASDKYREAKRQIDRNQRLSDYKAEDRFYMESAFIMDEFLLSGKVIFNDPLSKYINKVADVLFVKDDSLKGKLKIYTIKSPSVNAFATDEGIVLVTLGLLAQLENEAQLAFILAHEGIHFKRRHSVDIFVEQSRIERGQGTYGKSSMEEKIIARSHYSKEMELEADKLGLELFLESNYSMKVLDGVCDVLQYSYLPFDDILFDRSFFETDDLIFPENYYLEELEEIQAEDGDYDDSRSTHPNIRKRRQNMSRRISKLDDTGKVKYIVSEKEFLAVRDIARFELCNLYLVNREYALSIYNTYMLLEKYPNNRYLDKMMVKALYGLVKYRNDGILGTVHKSYKKIEGSSQQLYYFIKKLKDKELNVIALRYAWMAMQRHPEDESIKKHASELFKELVFEKKMIPTYFFDKSKEELIAEENIDTVADTKESLEGLSKYEKIRRKKVVTEIKGEEHFLKYALVDLMKDNDFIDEFEKQLDALEKDQEGNSDDYKVLKAKRKKKRKEARIVRRKGKALGIDKIVLVDPTYRVIDQRRNTKVSYLASEINQAKYIEDLGRNADRAELQVSILNTKKLQVSDIGKFNDHAILNQWLGELLDHEGDNMELTISNQEHVKYLTEKYNTKYFAWTGVISIRRSKGPEAFWLVVGGVATIYLLPYALYKLFTPDYDSFFYMVLFDIETGETELVQQHYLAAKEAKDIVNSNLYDSFHQIKAKRKEKYKDEEEDEK